MENSKGEENPQKAKSRLGGLRTKVGQLLNYRSEKPPIELIDKSTDTFDIIPPNPALLKKALSVDPRVKYLPSNFFDANSPNNLPIREWIKKELENSYGENRILGDFYNRLINFLIQDLFKKYPSAENIAIRGSAVNIGDTFSFPPGSNITYGDKIKGIREVVETGSEIVQGHDPFHGHGVMNYVHTSSQTFGNPSHGYPGLYASAHTKRVRNMVPPELKDNIHPIVLVRAGPEGELTDFYILDNLELKRSPKTNSPQRK